MALTKEFLMRRSFLLFVLAFTSVILFDQMLGNVNTPVAVGMPPKRVTTAAELTGAALEERSILLGQSSSSSPEPPSSSRSPASSSNQGVARQLARPHVNVMTDDANANDGYCPALSPLGVCVDETTAVEYTTAITQTSWAYESGHLLFHDAPLPDEILRTRESSPYPDSSCQGRDDGFLAPNGVGYVGGTSGSCGNEDAMEGQSGKGDGVGDVDSFIVAVRHGQGTENTSHVETGAYRNEAFRLRILNALHVRRPTKTRHGTPYHSILHGSGADEVHLYSVEEDAAAAKTKAGVQCTSWWCNRGKAAGKESFGGVTFTPLVVDAVVTHVDGTVPGFAREIQREAAALNETKMCMSSPPDGSPDDTAHTWRQEVRSSIPLNETFDLDRWRDWGELRYVLRGVFTHGRLGRRDAKQPAFRYRRVFLVVNTVEHAPEWLRKRAVGGGKYVYEERQRAEEGMPLLTIVPHSAFIPQCALPTYSSLGIEPFLYRIPGLSRWFVYVNDDTIVSRPMSLLDYFVPLPSVRQFAKVEALKRRHGEGVFAPLLKRNGNGDVMSQVVMLEPILYRERLLEGSLLFKENGMRSEWNGTFLSRRSEKYQKYLAMLQSRRKLLVDLSHNDVNDRQSEAVAPLRPSAFFDVLCRAHGPWHAKVMTEMMNASESIAQEDRFPSGFGEAAIAPSDHTCFNANLVFKKLDGAEFLNYFPHMSPLFDARMLRRLVGAPYIGEDNSAPHRVRGIFEEEFLGRALFNPLRRVSDPTVPMLYQPLAAAQRRYFTNLQLGARDILRLNVTNGASLTTTAADRIAVLDLMIGKVADLIDHVDSLAKAAGVEPATSVNDTRKSITKLAQQLDLRESTIAKRAVNLFHPGYHDNSEQRFWLKFKQLPANEREEEHTPSSLLDIPKIPSVLKLCSKQSQAQRLKCTYSLQARLSIRPFMDSQDTKFWFATNPKSLESYQRKITKWQGSRPLFVTVNDALSFDGALKRTSQELIINKMVMLFGRVFSAACGSSCHPAPWEPSAALPTRHSKRKK